MTPGDNKTGAILPGRSILKAWIVFLGVFGALMAVFSWADPWLTPRANALTAKMASWAMRLLGAEASSTGALVENSLFNVEIVWECTGITPISLFLSSVVAYPCAWRQRLIGLATGVPTLLAINMVRILSLIYVGRYFPEAFETVHVLVWQTLMIFFTVILWLVWIMKFVEPRESTTA